LRSGCGLGVLWFWAVPTGSGCPTKGEIGRISVQTHRGVSLTLAQAAITLPRQHWICLLDPSLLYIYDLDIGGWNVP
jgi:hypothetical protein